MSEHYSGNDPATGCGMLIVGAFIGSALGVIALYMFGVLR